MVDCTCELWRRTIIDLCCNIAVKTSVQARLDRRSQAALERLVKHLGWSPSKVVREGVGLLPACYGTPSRRKVVGTGRFASGLTDLGSNEKRLEGFGRETSSSGHGRDRSASGPE